jgi:hypothetical protein
LSIVLAPAYLLRWILDRKGFSILFVVAVALGAAIQLSQIRSLHLDNSPSPPVTLSLFLLCLQIVVVRVPWSLAAGYQPVESYWYIGLVLGVVLAGLMAWEMKADYRKHLFALGCAVLGSIDVILALLRISPLKNLTFLYSADRYFYIPKILFIWTLIHFASNARNPRPFYIALFFCMMGSLVEFTTIQRVADNHWPRDAVLIDQGQPVVLIVNPNPPGFPVLINDPHPVYPAK